MMMYYDKLLYLLLDKNSNKEKLFFNDNALIKLINDKIFDCDILKYDKTTCFAGKCDM